MEYRIGYEDANGMVTYAVETGTFKAIKFSSKKEAETAAATLFVGKSWFVE